MRINKAKVWFNIYRYCRWIDWTLHKIFLLFYLSFFFYSVFPLFFYEHNIHKKFKHIIDFLISNYIDPSVTFLMDNFTNTYSLIIFIFIFIFIISTFKAYVLDESLSQSFREWSMQHNWIYRSQKDYEIGEQPHFLDKLSIGENRYVFNYMRGTWHGLEAEAFNFHYQDREGFFNSSNNHGCYIGSFGYTSYSSSSSSPPKINHYYLGVVIVKLNPQLNYLRYCPLVEIRNKKIFDNFTLYFFQNNHDFNLYGNRLMVKCNNEEFEASFCNSNLMEYLLEQKNIKINIQLFGDYLIFYKNKDKINCYEVEKFLNILTEVSRLGIRNSSESNFGHHSVDRI